MAGVGSHLQSFFAWFGLKDTPGCHCVGVACLLDIRGPDWCEQRFPKIVRWLARGARKRGIPFSHPAAKIVLRWAIAKARFTRP